MECAKNVKDAVGSIDVLVHSLANGPEVAKPLLETSRKASSISLLPVRTTSCIVSERLVKKDARVM